MKKFQSRFEQLRRIRVQAEKLARVEAARRNSERDQALAQQAACEQSLQNVLKSASEHLKKPTTGILIAAMSSEVAVHEQNVADAEAAVQVATERVREAMEAYTTARRELKTVEEMIHREQMEHRQHELLLEEQKQQEQASQQWHTRRQDSERNLS